MSARDRGQAIVEVLVVVPVLLTCAVAIVDCGIVVRDRVAVAQAATRAAQAHVDGGDVLAAARGALSPSLARDARVTVDRDRITVSATSRGAALRVAGGVDHSSSATIPQEVLA